MILLMSISLKIRKKKLMGDFGRGWGSSESPNVWGGGMNPKISYQLSLISDWQLVVHKLQSRILKDYGECQCGNLESNILLQSWIWNHLQETLEHAQKKLLCDFEFAA